MTDALSRIERIIWTSLEDPAIVAPGIYAARGSLAPKELIQWQELLKRHRAVLLLADLAFYQHLAWHEAPRVIPTLLAQRPADIAAGRLARLHGSTAPMRALLLDAPAGELELLPAHFGAWACPACGDINATVNFDRGLTEKALACSCNQLGMLVDPTFHWLLARGGDDEASTPLHPLHLRQWAVAAEHAQIPFWFDGWGTWEPTAGAAHWTEQGRIWPEEGVAVVPSGDVILRDRPVTELVGTNRKGIEDGPGAASYRSRRRKVPGELQWFYRSGPSRSGHHDRRHVYRDVPAAIRAMIGT